MHIEFVATRFKGKRPLCRSRERRDDNIYVELKEVDCEDKGLMALYPVTGFGNSGVGPSYCATRDFDSTGITPT
jgi:hypothetical protein